MWIAIRGSVWTNDLLHHFLHVRRVTVECLWWVTLPSFRSIECLSLGIPNTSLTNMPIQQPGRRNSQWLPFNHSCLCSTSVRLTVHMHTNCFPLAVQTHCQLHGWLTLCIVFCLHSVCRCNRCRMSSLCTCRKMAAYLWSRLTQPTWEKSLVPSITLPNDKLIYPMNELFYAPKLYLRRCTHSCSSSTHGWVRPGACS